MEIRMKYDAIIIGAGNGGLLAATQLAKEKKNVLLLEQHNVPGGVATSFCRGRFEFDATLHEMVDIGSKEQPGDVRVLLEGLGINIDWKSIPELFRVIYRYSDGTKMDVTMPAGVKPFLKKFISLVPESEPSIKQLFRIMKQLNDLPLLYHNPPLPLFSKRTLKSLHAFLQYGHYSVQEVFRRLAIPQKGIDILSTYWSYLGVSIEDLNFLHYSVMIYGYINDGAYIPSNTSYGLASALAERYRELGGTLFLNTRAEKILTGPTGHVRGVQTSAGTFYSDYVIFNGNPSVAHKYLVPHHLLGIFQKNMIRSRKFSSRPFVVYLGLNKSAMELGLQDYSIFLPYYASSKTEYRSMKEIFTNHYLISVCPNVVNPTASPEGTCIVTLTTVFSSDCWNRICPEDYRQMKEKYAAHLINIFEKKTGCRLQPFIEEISISTPWTYYRYTGAPEGCGYGFEVGKWDNVVARYMTRKLDSNIKGLDFCGGADFYGNGYSTAQISGLMAANRLLKKLKKK
ncbi:MAG: phytoene desaturase family protein [Lachnospiraceae bacterium]